MDEVEVTVYRSVKRADTYVYLPEAMDFDELPEALRTHFGTAEPFLTFKLTATRHLAQADPAVVLNAISTQGFYLQLTNKDEQARIESPP